MANAPVFGSQYMTVTSSPANPPTKAELFPGLDPAFMNVWNQTKYLFPADWQGDNAIINAVAVIAYRYKNGTGVTTPAITTISPTTGPKNTAFTLTVNGTNFDANAIVLFNGVDKATTNASPTQLTVSILAKTIAVAGTYTVRVRNADGSLSGSATFTAT
jgi:IPT/TIG domain